MLYHVSLDNHDGEVFSPRVPESLTYYAISNEYEDGKSKRVCFSTTLSGAYRAIQFNDDEWLTLFVHVPYNKKIKFHRPTEEQVFDVGFTNEVWVQRRVKMKCIGKIRAKYKNSYTQWRPKVTIKWLEKY